jgi:hypothetical protein
MNKICEICKGGEHDSSDHPYLPAMETHSPLDIPFGHEIHEAFEEGGPNSGRKPEGGQDVSSNPLGGELISFETVSIPGGASAISIGAKKIEETITKQILDLKLNECPCKKSIPK